MTELFDSQLRATSESRVDKQKELDARGELASLSNWGRWGDADERGAANLVTLDAVRRGLAAVRHGIVFPLGAEIRGSGMGMYHSSKPNATGPKLLGVSQPLHFYSVDGGDAALDPRRGARNITQDTFITEIHGAGTHLDALAHVAIDGKMYNGVSGSEVRSYGARKLGVEKIGGLVTRGVLLDIAGYRGVDVLPPDDYITEADIVGCLDKYDLELLAGDAVLIRTGWPATYRDDPTRYGLMQPGVGSSAALFLAKREICVLGCDTAEIEPFFELDPRWHREDARYDIYLTHASPLPEDGVDWRAEVSADLHECLLRNLGVYLLEMLELDELAAAGHYEFQLALAPLRIRGASGSPVNPLAIV